jgi:hypothetical protein
MSSMRSGMLAASGAYQRWDTVLLYHKTMTWASKSDKVETHLVLIEKHKDCELQLKLHMTPTGTTVLSTGSHVPPRVVAHCVCRMIDNTELAD